MKLVINDMMMLY